MSYHVLIAYRNFHRHHHSSHVGLGVNGLHTARVLRTNGVLTDVAGVWQSTDVATALSRAPYTHCIIEAPWIATANMQQLLDDFPRVQFVCRCHSQIGFLQVEAGAITLFRDAALLESGNLNFRVAGNSQRFCAFFERAYGHPCLWLPNLYDCSTSERFHRHSPGQQLRIGSFGALRLMKNHSTSAAAALLIARRRKANLEFHVSVNREENPGSQGILSSLRNMFSGLNWAKLIEVPWGPWAQFRNLVGTMDLCLQLSQSETFNIVTADAASEHVPSVVSEVIDWVPSSYVAHGDSPEAAARVGDHLISDPYAGQEGYNALVHYVAGAAAQWKTFLSQSARQAVMGLPALT